MFYYKFTSGTPYCGTENDRYHKFEDKPKIDDLEEIAGEYAEQAYEDYSYLHSGWNDENLEDMTEEEAEEYMDNFRADCYCEYEEISREEYEDNLRNEGYRCLEDFIRFYNRVGNSIPYSKVRHSLIYYAKVDFIPDWNNNKIVDAWNDIVPEELANRIDCCGTGWYISDGDDNWDSWENYSAEYSKHNEIINKIVCGGE